VPRDDPTGLEARHREAVLAFLESHGDTARKYLLRAIEGTPNRAELWSDLAAVRLERAEVEKEPHELVLALEAANRALRLAPSLLPALFNRAVALERLTLLAQAQSGWQQLLSLEQDQLWAEEAREHLAQLAAEAPAAHLGKGGIQIALDQDDPGLLRQRVAEARGAARELFEGRLLSWAEWTMQREQGQAARALSQAAALAQALRATKGDPLPAEALAAIERLPSGDSASRRSLTAGLLAYREGLRLLASGDATGAASSFYRAYTDLREAGNPFSNWASYQIARCHYVDDHYPEARKELNRLLSTTVGLKTGTLRGRATYLLGLLEGTEGHFARSLEAFVAAEKDLSAVGEAALTSKVKSQQADTLDLLGQRATAWKILRAALLEPAAFPDPEIRQVLYSVASRLAKREGLLDIAIEFQEAALRSVPKGSPALYSVGALRALAQLHAESGNLQEAQRRLQEAWVQWERLPDKKASVNLRAELLLVEGQLALLSNPEKAAQPLSEALRIYRKTNNRYRLNEALTLRAAAYRALGDWKAEEADLTVAIEEAERQRLTINSIDDRALYLDRLRTLYDAKSLLQLERSEDAQAALRTSEQAKARVLWDWLTAVPESPAGPREELVPFQADNLLTQGLPPQTALLEYTVLPEKTAFWLVRGNRIVRSGVLNVSERDLSQRIERLRSALRQNRLPAARQPAGVLFDDLLRPLADDLQPGERLVVVPDGPLHTLPFGLLWDRQRGRHLFQDHVIAIAPSARIFLSTLATDRALAQPGPPRAFVASAPAFDPEIDPSLDPLKAGPIEEQTIQILPGSRVVSGSAATRRAFLEQAGSYEVAYFGGHSLVNLAAPALSQMLFADGPGETNRGALYAAEILEARFPRTRLVALASCRTADGSFSPTEGLQSLTRPFLAAGVPSVAGSLWSVHDRQSALFFLQYFAFLKVRFDSSWALQQTQIHFLDKGSASPVQPEVWSAFEVFGGGGWPAGPDRPANPAPIR
jgi:CHAT domain-containing protein